MPRRTAAKTETVLDQSPFPPGMAIGVVVLLVFVAAGVLIVHGLK